MENEEIKEASASEVDDLNEFIRKGLSLVCASFDSELNKIYFNAAEKAGIVEKTEFNPDYKVNGVNYKYVLGQGKSWNTIHLQN